MVSAREHRRLVTHFLGEPTCEWLQTISETFIIQISAACVSKPLCVARNNREDEYALLCRTVCPRDNCMRRAGECSAGQGRSADVRRIRRHGLHYRLSEAAIMLVSRLRGRVGMKT